jgi:DNA polymerase III delta prime subunit
MALSLSNLKSVRAVSPPRMLIYGPPGEGKTTLASEFPGAVLLQIEDGTPGGIELQSFGKPSSYGAGEVF